MGGVSLAVIGRGVTSILPPTYPSPQSQSTRDTPYEDPIPGASTWSLDELNTGLADFRALYDKVATLKTAYDSKTQVGSWPVVGKCELSI